MNFNPRKCRPSKRPTLFSLRSSWSRVVCSLFLSLPVLLVSGPNVFAADGDEACFSVVGNDGNVSAVRFYGGTFLRFSSDNHYSKNADPATYAANVVQACIASGWCSAVGNGGGSGGMEISSTGAEVKVTLVNGSPKTYINTNDAGEGSSTDFDPLTDIYFATNGCSAPPAPYCGDGTIDVGEACDDGNATNGDGCSDACAVETGYTCTGEPSACTLDPVPTEPVTNAPPEHYLYLATFIVGMTAFNYGRKDGKSAIQS